MKAVALLVVIAGLLSGCESTAPVAVNDPMRYLHGEAFPGYQQVAIESAHDVFKLDADAKRFVRKILASTDDPVDQMETLVATIFDHTDFNLLYIGSANTTASQTFHNRAANCLSMTIMTYAMAKEAGFVVRFQDIQIPEYWTRRDGFSLLNGHVNLQILPRRDVNVLNIYEQGFEVDFDPQNTRTHFPKVLVDRATVLAMFYNNKGADALLRGDYVDAFAYFRAAINQHSGFDSSWVNLGFLYRLTNHYDFAEEAYQQALMLDPDNLTAWENLAYLYELTDRSEEADAIVTRVRHARNDNPFYHFILGEQAFDLGQVKDALGHYQRALRLDRKNHEVYYGLAKSYFMLGDVHQGQMFLERAMRRAHTHQDKTRYRNKLDILSAKRL